MKTHEMEFDAFDTALSDILAGEEMPSVDFTSRVMAQVRETPQEKKTVRRVRRGTIAAIAACAAVVVLCAPFLRMFGGMGAMKAADSAAPAETAMDYSAADGAAPADDAAPGSAYGYSAEENNAATGAPAARDSTAEEPSFNEVVQATESEKGVQLYQLYQYKMLEDKMAVILEPEVFGEISVWLLEQGYPYEDGYHLTAADVALLNAQFPGLELEEMDCVLTSA